MWEFSSQSILLKMNCQSHELEKTPMQIYQIHMAAIFF